MKLISFKDVNINMKKITLALGGGGIKGFAHIGVIRQLLKEDFEIAAIAGTSVGGIVGSLYAAGFSPQEMESFYQSLDFQKMINRSPNDAPSLVGLQGFFNFLHEKLGDISFDDLKIPFVSTAVDINTGREIIINTGKILPAIQATSAIPGLFPAVRMGAMDLVDGGVLDPVPVSAARWLFPDYPIVAVSLSVPNSEWGEAEKIQVPSYVRVPDFLMQHFAQLRLSQAMKVFVDSNDITSNMIAELRLRIEKPDVLLHPKIYKYSIMDPINIDEAIAYGEESVKESLKDLNASFSAFKRINRWMRPSYMKGTLLSEIKPD
jgi:NTE family protein